MNRQGRSLPGQESYYVTVGELRVSAGVQGFGPGLPQRQLSSNGTLTSERPCYDRRGTVEGHRTGSGDSRRVLWSYHDLVLGILIGDTVTTGKGNALISPARGFMLALYN
eukprot:767787-Hanusia_phi.AAC.1